MRGGGPAAGAADAVMYVDVHQTFSVVHARPRRAPQSGAAPVEPSWTAGHQRVGELVQMHRLHQRLSISSLAAKVQLSAEALARIERGEETPTMDILERILSLIHI